MHIELADWRNELHVKAMVEMRNANLQYFKDKQGVTIEGTVAFLQMIEKDPYQYLFIVYAGCSNITYVPVYNGNMTVYTSYYSPETEIVGMFSIYNINRNSDAEFGRIVYRGTESDQFKDMVKDKLEEISDIFNLEYYYLQTYQWNKTAIQFFGGLGFVITDKNEDMFLMTQIS